MQGTSKSLIWVIIYCEIAHRVFQDEDSGSSSSESSEGPISDADIDPQELDGIADRSTDLVMRSGGGRIKLKKQHPLVRLVAKRAIRNLEDNIMLVNAFPDVERKTSEVAKDALIHAAKELKQKVTAQRVKNERDYCAKLVAIVRMLTNMR